MFVAGVQCDACFFQLRFAVPLFLFLRFDEQTQLTSFDDNVTDCAHFLDCFLCDGVRLRKTEERRNSVGTFAIHRIQFHLRTAVLPLPQLRAWVLAGHPRRVLRTPDHRSDCYRRSVRVFGVLLPQMFLQPRTLRRHFALQHRFFLFGCDFDTHFHETAFVSENR